MAALVVVMLALAPGVGLWLPFELGLRAQAGVILAVLAVTAWSGRRRLGAFVSALPGPVTWGLALYTLAAAWGSLVGLIAGNPLRNVMSQSLAMLLLPIAAVACSGLGRLRGRELADGLAVFALAAVLLHTAALIWPELGGRAVEPLAGLRFRLANRVSFAGPGLLVFLLSAARWRWQHSLAAGLGALAGLALVLGGLSRGEWVAAAAGIVLLGGLDSRPRVRWIFAGGSMLLVTVLVVAALAAAHSEGAGRPVARLDFGGEALESPESTPPPAAAEGVVVLSPRPDRRSRVFLEGLPRPAEAVELRGRLAGPPGTHALLWLVGRDESGNPVLRAWPVVSGTGEWMEVRGVVSLPSEVETLSVGGWSSGGRWLADEVEVWALDSPWLAWIRSWSGRPVKILGRRGEEAFHARWLGVLRRRSGQLIAALRVPVSDTTVRYRLEELRSIHRQWSETGVSGKLWGQGLGAHFPFRNPSWDASGRRVQLTTASYVHNLYVFFGFKLGIAGLAALGGLLMIAGWTLRCAWRGRTSGARSWLFAGAGAAWGAYLLWGMSSPEIVDFRTAPLLGALITVCVRERGGEGEEAGPR